MRRLINFFCATFLLFTLLLPVGGMVAAQDTPAPDTTAPPANSNALNPSDSISNICKNAPPDNLPPSCDPNSQISPSTPNPLFGPHGILTTAINLLSLAVGVISIFVIIIGGIKFITSSGDPSSVNSARNTILFAVIALLITIAAQASVRFLLSKL